MNINHYFCNVLIAGLMALLSSPAAEEPVYLWGSDSFNRPVEIDFEYGNFRVEYDGINGSSMHTKVLQLITEGDVFVPFMRGQGFLDVYLI